MNKVCIASRFDRYNIFFDLWIKNCLNYDFDIVIFLDGKVKYIEDKVAELSSSRKIFIIDTSIYGNIYRINNLCFFKKIFEKLYYDFGYDAIIYTDPDELILVEDFDLFLNGNENILVSKGFELFQSKDEGPYDLQETLLSQRKYGLWSDKSYDSKNAPYNKVCVFKKNIFPKNQGRHAYAYAVSPSRQGDAFIYLVHLREVCINTMIINSKENIELYKKNHKHHDLPSENEIIKRLTTWFYPYSVEIPDEIKRIIIKHNL